MLAELGKRGVQDALSRVLFSPLHCPVPVLLHLTAILNDRTATMRMCGIGVKPASGKLAANTGRQCQPSDILPVHLPLDIPSPRGAKPRPAGAADPQITIAPSPAQAFGKQIAAMTAASGVKSALRCHPAAADTARDWLRDYLAAPIAEGRLDWDLDSVLARIHPAHDLATALDGADLMIEAVREDLATKREVFRAASAANPDIYLATNSSSLPSAALRDVVTQTDKLVNLHFFSEFWHRSMVELMSCGETSEETMRVLHRFGSSLGIYCAVVRGQSKGFIINRVWRAVKREALRVVDEGHADPEDVDRLWALFWGIDYGPFGMMDEVGLDVIADIEDSYISVATDPADQRSKVLHERVARETGQEDGRGILHLPRPRLRSSRLATHEFG